MNRPRWFPALACGLLALALRAWNVSADPLWADEIHVAMATRQGLVRAIQLAAADVQPPLFYALAALVPAEPMTLRWLSVFAGAATVMVVARAAAHAGPKAAWFAGLWLALLPAHIHWSQELRVYALLAFLVALGAANILRAGPALLTGLVGSAILYAHGLGPLFLLALAAQAAMQRARSHAIAVVVSGVTFLPWVSVSFAQRDRYEGWQTAVPEPFALTFASYLSVGHGQAAVLSLAALPILVAMVAAAPASREGRGIVLGFAVGAALLASCAPWLGYVMAKHALPLLPLAALGSGLGVTAIRRDAVRIPIAVGALLGPIVGLVLGAQHEPVRFDIGTVISNSMQARDGRGPMASTNAEAARFFGATDVMGLPSPGEEEAFGGFLGWATSAYAGRIPVAWWSAEGPDAAFLEAAMRDRAVVWSDEERAAYGVATTLTPGVPAPLSEMQRDHVELEQDGRALGFYQAGSARLTSPAAGFLSLWATGSTAGDKRPELEVGVGETRPVCAVSPALQRFDVGAVEAGQPVSLAFVHDEATSEGDLNVWVYRVEVHAAAPPADSFSAACAPR